MFVFIFLSVFTWRLLLSVLILFRCEMPLPVARAGVELIKHVFVPDKRQGCNVCFQKLISASVNELWCFVSHWIGLFEQLFYVNESEKCLGAVRIIQNLSRIILWPGWFIWKNRLQIMIHSKVGIDSLVQIPNKQTTTRRWLL